MVDAIIFAYGVIFREFWALVRVSWFPFTLAALVLYVSLTGYLAELLSFLAAPNERVASLALGILTSGILLSLFCYGVAILAIGRVAAGAVEKHALFQFRAKTAEWRLFAGYLRFILLAAMVAVALTFLALFVAPRLDISSGVASIVATRIGWVAIYFLLVRIGFFIAPVAAYQEGPIIRAAWTASRWNILSIAGLIALLMLPGLLIQIGGEYLLGEWSVPPFVAGHLPFADYARFMQRMLGGFLIVLSVSLFVTIVLLTAASVSFYKAVSPASFLKR